MKPVSIRIPWEPRPIKGARLRDPALIGQREFVEAVLTDEVLGRVGEQPLNARADEPPHDRPVREDSGRLG